MKFYFNNVESLADGISLVAGDLGITLSDAADADVTVNVVESGERISAVALDGKVATITYGDGKARFFRGLATLVDWVKSGETKKDCVERPLFTTNGTMVDMSRNAVMNVKTVKSMMRKMALMGMNMYMLYTEDTYEIDNHPYFGYMRGRYTDEEIKDLDSYALKLGIELIPCIQTLGHLATHLKHNAAGGYKDTNNALLVGVEATYKLIADMLDTVSRCFTTRRIHVGMDETHDLGRGKYIDMFGYRERQDIYFEHLAKVIEMSRERGLEPMMWSDMFFRLAGKNLNGFNDYDMRVEFSDEVIAKIPKGIQQVFWDYYQPKEEFYETNIEKHRKVFGEDTIFAGGVWTFSGYGPLYSRSLRNTLSALDACKKGGVKEIIATVWHNGSEGSLVMSLPGLAWYADYDYKGEFNEDSVRRCFKAACDADLYDTLMKCELIERPCNTDVSVSRAFMYNDPMTGLLDNHFERMDLASYYKSITPMLEAAKGDKGEFNPAYDIIVKLSSLFENKADFGIRLKAAYDNGDKEVLKTMADECDVIIEKLIAVKNAHRASWMEYNKPFGWEVFDIRYGGQIARFQTAKERINAYLAGEIERLEELEEARLRLDGGPMDAENKMSGWFVWWQYQKIATVNNL